MLNGLFEVTIIEARSRDATPESLRGGSPACNTLP